MPAAVRVMGQYWTFGELRQLAIGKPMKVAFQRLSCPPPSYCHYTVLTCSVSCIYHLFLEFPSYLWKNYSIFPSKLYFCSEYPPSRYVTFQEFLGICSRKFGTTIDRSQIDKAFDVFDRDRSGRVLLNDVKHVLTAVGEKLTVSSTKGWIGRRNIRLETVIELK